jgi:peptide deformylase
MRSIVIHPDDILRNKNVDLEKKPSKSLLSDMYNIVNEKKGVGIAAPQVGENLNIFILNLSNDKTVFVNPKIVYYSTGKSIMEEGCLSLPGELIEIERPEIVHVEYLDKNFKKKFGVFDGLKARVIQHEYDHLLGKLIIDYKQ